MKKKILSFVLSLCLIISCAFLLSGCFDGEGADATLYHLKLSANISSVQQSELVATYGYGEPSTTVKQGVRDEEDIEELKKAGATQADIDKAGQRQTDGSYYFFDQDPIYLEAPKVDGYKLLGFYNKANNQLVLNPILQQIDGGMYLPRYNMDNKPVELEARYQKWTYEVHFDEMITGDTNPNDISNYCYIDDGVVSLVPATTSNTHKTFCRWEYQDCSNTSGGQADWIPLEKSGNNFNLPVDYYENIMRIRAVWNIDKYTISFAFELYIDPDTTNILSFEQACSSILVHGNNSTVDNVPVYCETQEPRTMVNKNSELKMEYGSWLNIFPTVNSQYRIWEYKINNNEGEVYNDNLGYIALCDDLITENSTITLVLANV